MGHAAREPKQIGLYCEWLCWCKYIRMEIHSRYHQQAKMNIIPHSVAKPTSMHSKIPKSADAVVWLQCVPLFSPANFHPCSHLRSTNFTHQIFLSLFGIFCLSLSLSCVRQSAISISNITIGDDGYDGGRLWWFDQSTRINGFDLQKRGKNSQRLY